MCVWNESFRPFEDSGEWNRQRVSGDDRSWLSESGPGMGAGDRTGRALFRNFAKSESLQRATGGRIRERRSELAEKPVRGVNE